MVTIIIIVHGYHIIVHNSAWLPYNSAWLLYNSVRLPYNSAWLPYNVHGCNYSSAYRHMQLKSYSAETMQQLQYSGYYWRWFSLAISTNLLIG
jgi:hypothetical protein